LIYATRLAFLLVATTFVYLAPRFKNTNGEYSAYFYLAYFIIMIIGGIIESTSWVTCMSFSAQTSDPKIGGTYLCLTNTVCNLGFRSEIKYLCIFIKDYYEYEKFFLN
jgi:hypothetical protein